MDYSNQQVICATCNRWSGKRKQMPKSSIVKSDSINSGICQGGASNNFNTHPGAGRGCGAHVKWEELACKP